MSKIIVLGAAGRMGRACCEAFLNAGWDVYGLTRGGKAAQLPDGVVSVEADAMDVNALSQACEGMDVILHALNPARYDQWDDKVLKFGENVLAAAKATGATVMIPGNVYNYGTGIGLDVDESAPFAPDTSKGQIRVALEQMFEKTAPEVRTIVLRAGDFFGGKGVGTWLDLMILKDLKKGKFTWPGPKDTTHAFAYLPDFAQCFVAIAEKRNSLSAYETFHFAGHTVTGETMKTSVEKAVGRTLKTGHVPWWLIRVIGLFNPLLKAVVEMSYLWRVEHSLDGSKLERLIDVPHTPLDDAIHQTISDQRLG